MAKDQAASILVENSEEGQKARFDAVMEAVVGDVTGKPQRKPYLEAFAELYAEEAWEEEIEDRWLAKKEEAGEKGTKLPPAPHVRRDYLRTKWFAATPEERDYVHEEIERQYMQASDEYAQSTDVHRIEPPTPEEAAKYVYVFVSRPRVLT